MKSKHIVKMKSTLLQAFTCTYCEQYFSSLGARKRHVMRHKSKYLRWIKAKKRSPFIRSVLAAPYQCAVCNASFVKISSLENHVKVNHILVAAYGCNVCSFASFQDSDSYEHHVADHVKNTLKLKAPYQCVYCKQCFVITSMLRRHLKAKHKEMNLLAMKYNLKVFQCSYCKECFADTIKLQIHIRKTHGIDRPYYCKFCRKCFTNFSSLSDHAQLMHTANPYHCEFCYLRFPDFPALAHHTDQMHREDAYSCQVCNHTFADYSSVARHAERTHKHRANVPLAPYMCEICREAHYSATDLIIHARVIHGYTWADLAQDLAECLQKPIRFQDEREKIVRPQETSDSGQMIKLVRSISANTNDRIAEPETSSPEMVLGSNSVMDRWKAAKTELESLLDLLCGAATQDSQSHLCQTSPEKLQVGPSALTKNTWMSGIPGCMSSPTVYINAVKKRIHKGKVHDHTYTRPPVSLHLVEHEDEKDVDDVVTEETQSQSQILSKQEAATNPQQRHLKTLVGSQNGTVVPTKIALSSMQPVVSLVNMKSLLRGAFCKPRIKLLLLDANGKPRRRQPYLEKFCKKYFFSVYERKRREEERFRLLALGEQVPALTSKERVTKDNILNYSTEYILTLRNEEEKLLAAKEMERQRHEQLQGRLRNLQVENVVTYSLSL